MVNNKVGFDVLTRDYHRGLDSRQRERSKAFDFIRGLAVLFMVMVHVQGAYASLPVQSSAFGFVIDYLGGPPAAPVFMFSMGVFYVLSSKSDRLKDGVIRGLKLLLLGCLLSFLRSDLMPLLGFNTDPIVSSSTDKLMCIWEIDILQFAGWAYILMSLIKHYFKKPIWWLIIAMGIMIISPLLWGISSDITIINWICNFLWGMGDLVYFPVFGWLFYPLVGMIFGVYMQNWSDTKKLMNAFFRIGLGLLAIGGIIIMTNYELQVANYFHGGYGLMIWIIGFVFVWLWIANKITKNVKQNKMMDIIYYWGKETPTIYFIHWILVSWGTMLFGYEKYGYIGTVVLMIVMLAATHLFTKGYKELKRLYLSR